MRASAKNQTNRSASGGDRSNIESGCFPRRRDAYIVPLCEERATVIEDASAITRFRAFRAGQPFSATLAWLGEKGPARFGRTQVRRQSRLAATVGGSMEHRTYRDLHAHIASLEQNGLLVRVKRPINKDTEMHPLVRWQFRG